VTVLVESYRHRTGEHCASTALRNLLAHDGLELSEGMVFGLASGLGFFYLQGEGMSPTRMFHGRTISLESDLGANTGIRLRDRPESDDDRAFAAVRERIDRGTPVMVSTDTFYLPYQNTKSHFPGHRCVLVGYDDATRTVLIADRKFDAYQSCSFDDLRRARNAPDYPMSCDNQYGDAEGRLTLGRPLEEAIRIAVSRNARAMLEPAGELPAGIPAMRALASELADWGELEDWSWAARFGYQVVVKRGSGGSFFRSLYTDFLEEAAQTLPQIREAGLPARMDEISGGWREVADLLKEQSEREDCAPELFDRAAEAVARLADEEAGFFTRLEQVLA